MRNEDGTKWLPVARLIELLANLPPDSRVTPNAVGNLLAISADGRSRIAYIDFLFEGHIESLEDGD